MAPNFIGVRTFILGSLCTEWCSNVHDAIAVVILSRASLIASDVIVLLVTWWQLYGSLIPRSQQSQPLSALSVLLLRDSEFLSSL